jgi:hypothetical protein
MVRPRWHDALLTAAVLGLLLAGVWSLWWDDVRSALHLGPAPGAADPTVPVPAASGQT